jgi:Flp pilus assembly pilin Flp
MVTNVALRTLVQLRRALARMQDEDGQTLAEYGLILSVISVFVVGGSAVLLRGSIEAVFTTAAGCLDGSC